MDNDKITCEVCGMQFDSKEEHDKHHKEAHGDEGEAKEEPMDG